MTSFADRYRTLIFMAIVLTAVVLVVLMAGLSTLWQSQQEQAQATQAAGLTATVEFLEFHYQKGLGYANLGRWRDAEAEFENIVRKKGKAGKVTLRFLDNISLAESYYFKSLADDKKEQDFDKTKSPTITPFAPREVRAAGGG